MAGIPGEPVSIDEMSIKTGYGGGNAIALQTARAKVGEWEETRSVSATDKSISFTLDLKAGPTHLQTFLTEADGADLGAYYVYIDKMR